MWLLAVLGLAMAGVVSALRLENRQSHAELQRSKAMIAAEGGVYLAVHGLLTSPERFPADGRVQQFDLDGVVLAINVRSEHGKLDVNFAGLEHFARLVQYMGATPAEAQTLVGQLQARRNAGDPLEYLKEVLIVSPAIAVDSS